VTDGSDAIDLSLDELRQVTGWAVACVRPALMIFERIRSDDPRARNALDVARAFAEGGKLDEGAPRCRVGRAPGGASGTGHQPAGCARRRASSRPRGGRGLPAPPRTSAPGEAHPGLCSSHSASNRSRRRRPRRWRRLHRTRREQCAARSYRCLEALSDRADWRWPRRRTRSPAGRSAALSVGSAPASATAVLDRERVPRLSEPEPRQCGMVL
jgi:hypothetical protein